MLNEKGIRELAYAVKIDAIEPITGSDNCEAAVVGGWKIMVRKEQFDAGDVAIYFEIDSKVPETEQFAFLAKKHYKVKTQKYTFGGKGNFISQGLLMAVEDFGWSMRGKTGDFTEVYDAVNDKVIANIKDESRFLTEQLGVTYSDPEDVKRKANSADKYKKMSQRHQKLFKTKPIRWLMRRSWGRKLLFIFFGKKRDKATSWPAWVSKTDEERVQNMPWIINNKEPWVATEKIDGTSTTFTAHKKKFGNKYDFYVCSRNVVFDKPNKQCFYDTNVYTEMAEKYDVEKKLVDFARKNNYEWVTLQGETYGEGIQRRDYSTKEHKFAGFNLITPDIGRWNSVLASNMMHEYDIPWVPIVDIEFTLPDTVEEILDYATDNSVVDGKEREGVVFRSADGKQSFKAVSNEFIIKYH